MLARTDRGREVRLYFIDVEKRYQRELGQVTPLEASLQRLADMTSLMVSGAHGRISEVEHQVKAVDGKVESLATKFDEYVRTQSSQVVYVFANIRDAIVKVGFTEDLAQRTKQHAIVNLTFMGAIPAGRSRERHVLNVLKEKKHRKVAGDEYFALTYGLVEDLQQLGLNVGMLADYNKAKTSITKKVADGGTIPLF
jgi:hypothetical protein